MSKYIAWVREGNRTYHVCHLEAVHWPVREDPLGVLFFDATEVSQERLSEIGAILDGKEVEIGLENSCRRISYRMEVEQLEREVAGSYRKLHFRSARR